LEEGDSPEEDDKLLRAELAASEAAAPDDEGPELEAGDASVEPELEVALARPERYLVKGAAS
jgi:hypothetical protein